jgi:hypothetical protein
MSMLFATAQCDLFRLGEAERGAIQSKATVRSRTGDDRTRLGTGHTPRSKTVPLELNC